MYGGFFGFREDPFNLTPDPKFLYLNASYREALAALRHGVTARKGFVSLIGEAGTGKTTLLRCLLADLEPGTRSVLVLNPAVGFDQLLAFILTDLGRPPRPGMQKLELLQTLNAELLDTLARGGNVVVLIDEAQDLAISVLEELRLLSNLETAKEKILQFVLAGQPELDLTLARPELRQLRQRIAVPARIRPLARGEVQAYVAARVAAAGGDARGLFTRAALRRLWRFSRGVPRLVNVACDTALVNAYAAGTRRVGWRMMDEAVRDFRPPGGVGASLAKLLPRLRTVTAAAAVGVVVGLGVGRLGDGTAPTDSSLSTAARGTADVKSAAPSTERGTDELVALAAHGERSGETHQQLEEQAGVAVERLPAVEERESVEPDKQAGVVAPAVVPGAEDGSHEVMATEVSVERGDTLGHIARRHYGRDWPYVFETIQQANPTLVDIDTLAVGQKIILPPYNAKRSVGSASSEQGAESLGESSEGRAESAKKTGAARDLGPGVAAREAPASN